MADYDRYEHEGGGGFMMGLLTGTVLGAGLGMLLAPKAGAELRGALGEQARSFGSRASEQYRRASGGTVVPAMPNTLTDTEIRHRLTRLRNLERLHAEDQETKARLREENAALKAKVADLEQLLLETTAAPQARIE
jgi:gas vesicle protein